MVAPLISETAEQHVIGGCLLDNPAYYRICGMVCADDFAIGLHRKIWEQVVQSSDAGDNFDAFTVADVLELPAETVLALQQETPGTANIESYARIVRDRAVVREAIREIEAARGELAGGNKDAIAGLQASLERLHRTERPSASFYEALQAGLSEIEAAQERALAANGIIGAPTGIKLLDNRTGGLHGPKLIILAARPSLGKTALALQMAQAAAVGGFPVGIVSLEMSAGEIAVRAFAHQYGVNNTALAHGDGEAVELLTRRLASDPDKMNVVKTLPIHIDEDTFTLSGIVGRITEWHRRFQIRLAVVDHLQLIECAANKTRNDALGDITRQLKILAKRLDIPVLLVCQLNRNVEREQRKPRLSDLRDSGNIEQDADIVMSLHGALEVNHHGARDIEVGFLKFRGGVVGWAGTLVFNGPTQTFRPPAFEYEP